MENATTLNTNYQIKLTTRNQHTEKGVLKMVSSSFTQVKNIALNTLNPLNTLNTPKYIDLHEQSILVISVLDAGEMSRDKD